MTDTADLIRKARHVAQCSLGTVGGIKTCTGDHTDIRALLRALAARLEAAERLAEAALRVCTYEGAEAEPCWRCGGGGAHCEERIHDLEAKVAAGDRDLLDAEDELAHAAWEHCGCLAIGSGHREGSAECIAYRNAGAPEERVEER